MDENYMKTLLDYAKKSHRNAEYHFCEDTQSIIVTRDKGKWVFEVSYYDNGDIKDECLHQPLD